MKTIPNKLFCRHSSFRVRTVALAFISSAALALGACSPSTTTDNSQANEALSVSASFYPVAWLAEQIGGDNVSVTSITPANQEPHDFELAPADITKLSQADVLLYVKGFQPSVDDAVDELTGPAVTDLSDSVDLQAATVDDGHHHGEHGHDHDDHDDHDHDDDADHDDHDDHDHDDDDHDDHDHADHDDHDDHTLGLDPHFWLDPLRMSKAAEAVANALSTADPSHKDEFTQRLADIQDELADLNAEFENGLDQCELTTFVTSHAAFGYLATRYHLTQESISGIDPEAEPSPAELAAVAKTVEKTGITTIFTEELVSPKVAEALAAETGTSTAVLSPLESQPESGDYISAMRNNLKELQAAMRCN